MADIYIHNSLSDKKEKFLPIKEGILSMYNCGPTVYNFAHIGNLRSYVFADILRRVFEYNGYKVNQVINVTDIGHLSSDGDDGEDKMTKALKREGKPLTLKAMREVADYYFEKFKIDIAKLNIKTPTQFPFASDHIAEDIELVEILKKNGFVYNTSDGLYFDTSKYSEYGKLGNIQNYSDLESRIGLNSEKKNQRDFAVWKFNNDLGYTSPFGNGFPGWHIECSAMSLKYLGKEFDIHTGGIDHIPVHHNNEIAQSLCAGYPFAKYWLHNAHLNIGEDKMAKSGQNFITLNTLEGSKIDPLALRYLFLGARYSSNIQFSFEALEGAQSALKRLREKITSMPDGGKVVETDFNEIINDDLDTPKALALCFEILKNTEITDEDKKATIIDFDRVFGLSLDRVEKVVLPQKVVELLNKRKLARENKNFNESDRLREEIESLGFTVKDNEDGQIII